MEGSLETLREEINRIDENIIGLLSKRMEIAKNIAALKKEKGIPIEDKERERTLLLKLKIEARKNNLSEDLVSYVFGAIISHSKLIQSKLLEEQE